MRRRRAAGRASQHGVDRFCTRLREDGDDVATGRGGDHLDVPAKGRRRGTQVGDHSVVLTDCCARPAPAKRAASAAARQHPEPLGCKLSVHIADAGDIAARLVQRWRTRPTSTGSAPVLKRSELSWSRPGRERRHHAAGVAITPRDLRTRAAANSGSRAVSLCASGTRSRCSCPRRSRPRRALGGTLP